MSNTFIQHLTPPSTLLTTYPIISISLCTRCSTQLLLTPLFSKFGGKIVLGLTEGLSRISVRKYQSGNQKCTIQRNWHHRVHKTKKNRVKHHTKIFVYVPYVLVCLFSFPLRYSLTFI
jgi:hypothetical protein